MPAVITDVFLSNSQACSEVGGVKFPELSLAGDGVRLTKACREPLRALGVLRSTTVDVEVKPLRCFRRSLRTNSRGETVFALLAGTGTGVSSEGGAGTSRAGGVEPPAPSCSHSITIEPSETGSASQPGDVSPGTGIRARTASAGPANSLDGATDIRPYFGTGVARLDDS